MIRVTLDFQPDLHFFLSRGAGCNPVETSFHVTRSVKDLIESAGVPHVEVGCILINGNTAAFDDLVVDGDSVSVFGIEAVKAEGLPRLGPAPQKNPSFIADVHLKTLVRSLRMLGFDILYDPGWQDSELASISEREDRTLLSRDTRLLMRSNVVRGMYVRSTDPDRQVVEVVKRYDLSNRFNPLKRCIVCNGEISALAEGESAPEAVPPEVWARTDRFYRCDACGKYYWNGSHVERMLERIENIRRELG